MNHRVVSNERDSNARVLLQGNAGTHSHEFNVILRDYDISRLREVVNNVAQVVHSLISLYLFGRRVQFRGRNLPRQSTKNTKVFPNQFNHFLSASCQDSAPRRRESLNGTR